VPPCFGEFTNTVGTCASSSGALFHFHQAFGEQWRGRGGQVNWPTQSPDLNPLHFLLWRRLKTLVYSGPMNGLVVLQQRVVDARQKIRVKTGEFKRERTYV
jgi:hypothetical protein